MWQMIELPSLSRSRKKSGASSSTFFFLRYVSADVACIDPRRRNTRIADGRVRNLPRGLLNSHNLLILPIHTGLYTFKVVADQGRKSEGTRVLGIEPLKQRAEGARVRTKGRAHAATGIAEPVSRHAVLEQRRVDAMQMECPSASIAAQELTTAAAG